MKVVAAAILAFFLLVPTLASAGADEVETPNAEGGDAPPETLTVTPVSAEDAARVQATAAPAVAAAQRISSNNRFVRIDAAALRTALRSGRALLDLGAGAAVELGVMREQLSGTNETWWGTNAVGESVAVVLAGEAVSARLQLRSGTIFVTHVESDLHLIHDDALRELAPAIGPRTAEADVAYETLPPGVQRLIANPIAQADMVMVDATTVGARSAPVFAGSALPGAQTTSTIDVMFVYDNSAQAYFDPDDPVQAQADAEAAADLAIGIANGGFAASGVDLVLNRVHVEHVDYDTSGSTSTDLYALSDKYDNVIDEVHQMRETYSADVVTLLTEPSPGNNSCAGIAWLLGSLPNSNTDHLAFSVVEATCMSTTVFEHEMGHNLGAAHDVANASNPGALPASSYGHVDVAHQFVTVMSYRNSNNGCTGCQRISQFSSDALLWNTYATGSASANNALTVDQTRSGVAAYRPQACPPPAYDDLPGRAVLGVTYLSTVTNDITCATQDATGAVWYTPSPPLNTVWYAWTAPATGTATASTCNTTSNFDTDITILSDGLTGGGLTPLTYSNNSGACAIDNSLSIASWPVVAGTTYNVRVDGAGAATGTFELTISMPGAPLCNGLPVDIVWGPGAVATNGPDVILGTSGVDNIDGLAGDDTICALGDNDIVNGGDGDDTIFAGEGDDDVRGQGDNDTIHGEGGDDKLRGGDGSDNLYGGPDNDFLNGQADADMMWGEAGEDRMRGGDGVDMMWGGPDKDFMQGGEDGDFMYGEGGNDRLSGNNGADTIEGGDQPDRVYGGDGNDVIDGGAANDLLNGQGDNDTISGGLNNDVINGGTGSDMLSGNEGDDELRGQDGDDDLFGGDGDNDILIGGSGADDLDGGTGLADLCNGSVDTDADTAVGCETLLNVP